MNETIMKELLTYTSMLKNREIEAIDIIELENGYQQYQVESFKIEYNFETKQYEKNMDDVQTTNFYVKDNTVLYTNTINGQMYFHKNTFQLMKNEYALKLGISDSLVERPSYNCIETKDKMNEYVIHYEAEKIDLITKETQQFTSDVYQYLEMPKLTCDDLEIILDNMLTKNKTR